MAKKKLPLVLAVPAGVVAFFVAAFIGIWLWLSPSHAEGPPVAFSDFLVDVHAGKVREIHIQDREYRYWLAGPNPSGRPIVKVTIGPIADERLVSSLRPDDASLPSPKIYFMK
jgi:hypothetical protein